MAPTILLFDVDGTLLDTGGAGRRAVERAFGELHGRPDACSGFGFDGMTDRAIVRAGLVRAGVDSGEAAIDALLSAYLSFLAAEVEATARYRVYPGMLEAIAHGERGGAALGLGTGNVREGARLKLARAGLFGRFSFGGFGCDHEERAELIRIGAGRGAEQLGVPVRRCRVVVVGDTPKDVAAARAIGAESVGVGTGAFRPAELLAAGATAAFEDLTAPGALEALLPG